MSELASKRCEACAGGVDKLADPEVHELMGQLHSDWQIDETGKTLTRRFSFKGFAKAVYLTNLVVYLADREGHHPDVAFGWGYCHVSYTTHEAGGLTQNDFICAAQLDALVV